MSDSGQPPMDDKSQPPLKPWNVIVMATFPLFLGIGCYRSKVFSLVEEANGLRDLETPLIRFCGFYFLSATFSRLLYDATCVPYTREQHYQVLTWQALGGVITIVKRVFSV